MLIHLDRNSFQKGLAILLPDGNFDQFSIGPIPPQGVPSLVLQDLLRISDSSCLQVEFDKQVIEDFAAGVLFSDFLQCNTLTRWKRTTYLRE